MGHERKRACPAYRRENLVSQVTSRRW